MARLVFFMLLIASFSGCGSGDSTPASGPQKIKPEEENDLLLRLSGELVVQPRSLPQEEQNQIINYAIDKMLDVRPTISGMYYQIIEPGKGSTPKSNSTVTAHYVGRTLQGKIFDSSYSRGKPQQFNLASVVPGWRQAIKMLKPGGRGLFLLPSHLGYAEAGLGELIPPNTVLQFEIELVKVE